MSSFSLFAFKHAVDAAKRDSKLSVRGLQYMTSSVVKPRASRQHADNSICIVAAHNYRKTILENPHNIQSVQYANLFVGSKSYDELLENVNLYLLRSS